MTPAATEVMTSQSTVPVRTVGRPLLMIVGLTVVALVAQRFLVPWAEMWLIVLALFGGFKWLTWRDARSRGIRLGFWQTVGYLAAWPGLNADEFQPSTGQFSRPAPLEWLAATANTLFGAAVVWGVVRWLPGDHPVLVGSVGFAGILFVLHFGTFHLMALGWRRAGYGVGPIMCFPLGTTSLADFWGNRWNRAYRQVSLDYFFRPWVNRCGVAGATLVAFLISGLLHELVISFPADGGYGGPTTYFVIQGFGLLLERTRCLRQWLCARAIRRRLCTATILAAPLGLLFHGPFLSRVIVPFLSAIGAV